MALPLILAGAAMGGYGVNEINKHLNGGGKKLPESPAALAAAPRISTGRLIVFSAVGVAVLFVVAKYKLL